MDKRLKSPKESRTKGKEEVQFSHAGGSEVLLMADMQPSDDLARVWYVDSGCSNHMTGTKS